MQTISCNTEINCPVDCVGSWSPYSDCSHTCGPDGRTTTTHTITTAAAYGGRQCDYTNGYTISQPCNTQYDCPIDCVGSWSTCNSNCVKTYTITTQANESGQNCDYQDGEEDSETCQPGEGQSS